MSFFEDIASALDAEGIESRVHDDVMFVPITPEIEIQFVEIDPHLPAANVYIADAAVSEDDDGFQSALVSVVFSVEDAVARVGEHVATNQVVTLLRDLLQGTDERISDLSFYPDDIDPTLVRADVGQSAEIHVGVSVQEHSVVAHVKFVVTSHEMDEWLDEAIDEVWGPEIPAALSEEDRARLFNNLQSDLSEEVLVLGDFEDFDKLFDVLSLASDQAEEWESQLDPLDFPDFGDVDPLDFFDEDAINFDDSDTDN